MTWGKFLLGFLLVVLLSFARSQLTPYWVPIDFSIFLIFVIIRSSDIRRALILTFILSLSLDIIFQAGQTKGLAGMGQLVIVYVIISLRRYIIPAFEDLFLVGSFAFFYLANYYIHHWLSNLFSVTHHSVSLVNLIFFTMFHTVLFGLLLIALIRINHRRQ